MAEQPRAKLDIETYNRKRDFAKTREPRGRKLKGKSERELRDLGLLMGDSPSPNAGEVSPS